MPRRASFGIAIVGLSLAIASLVHASTGSPLPTTVTDADNAIGRLQDALLRRDGDALDCLAVLPEDDAGDGWSFALHEVHDARCGGDPDISPVRARYRVSAAGEVSVYDAAEDAYVALP